MTEWFRESFGEDYLRLYPHRDDEDARRAVELIDTVVPLTGRRVLDLACGPGRHAAHLTARGARVTGLDLSPQLLARARARLGDRVPLVRADMRNLPFRGRVFGAVVNLFTSFGYFDDDAQHRAVLAGAAAALEPGGTLVIDYLNADLVRRTLVAKEEKVMGGEQVWIERSITPDGRFVVKETRLASGRRFRERVRLLGPEDLDQLLASVHLQVRRRFGAYDGSAPGPDAPRAIFVAVRTA